jgi:hypothetical protein
LKNPGLSRAHEQRHSGGLPDLVTFHQDVRAPHFEQRCADHPPYVDLGTWRLSIARRRMQAGIQAASVP